MDCSTLKQYLIQYGPAVVLREIEAICRERCDELLGSLPRFGSIIMPGMMRDLTPDERQIQGTARAWREIRLSDLAAQFEDRLVYAGMTDDEILLARCAQQIDEASLHLILSMQLWRADEMSERVKGFPDR